MRAIAFLVAVSTVSVTSAEYSPAIMEVVASRAELPLGFRITWSCGKLYYRTMLLDDYSTTMYVGAMDHIFKINSKHVNSTP